MIELVAPHRGTDDYGSGAFGAPRGKKKHRGIDLAAANGSGLKSPIDGVVSKWGFPYADTTEFRYIQVTDMEGLKHRFFYCMPLLEKGTIIKKGDVIARVQNIAGHYSEKRMVNHLHYEVKTPNGEYINPGSFE